MKILHVIDSLSMGGAENLVVQLAIHQSESGHEVEIVGLTKPNTQTLQAKLDAANVKHYSLSEGSPYNPLLIFKLKNLIKRTDVVHVHLFPAMYWAILAKILGNRHHTFIFTEHSTNNKRRDNYIWRKMDEFVYKRYDGIVACSDKTKETFKRCYPSVPISVIPNGIDVDYFANAKPYSKQDLIGVTDDSTIITMVASFRYPKRQDTLVYALESLPQDYHVVFVGDGPKKDEIESLVKNLNLDGRVHFLGIRADVNRILKTSDVIVMSSEYEGLSLSSIEGMASGKPFVASNVNGLREVVQGAGELFEPNAPGELASILKQLHEDTDFYEKTKARCQNRAMQYDIKDVVSEYLEFYQLAQTNGM